MKRKGKLGFSIIILALVVALVSYFLIRQNQKKSNSESCDGSSTSTECKVDLSSTSNSSVAAPATSGSISGSVSAIVASDTYKNTDYGFQIELNSAWSNYKIDKKTEAGVEAVYEISIPTSDKVFSSGRAVPLTIKVYAISTFNNLESSNLTKISQNSRFVFAYKIWDNAPSDANLTEKDIAKVVSTFKLN